MKKIFYLFVIIMATSCDDGDLIVKEFDFDDVAIAECNQTTTGSQTNYLFYKNKTETNESLILSFNSDEDIFEVGTYSIPPSQAEFEYRKFNAAADASYFCATIPPTSPEVIENFVGSFSSLQIETAIAYDDDEDGIPTEFELDEDTDGDGIPNFQDFDDDGDNVSTINEGVLNNNGEFDSEMLLDTDGDGTPNYLDDDDDGDEVPTKQESIDGDDNPANDSDPNDPDTPAYLSSDATESANPKIESTLEHTFKRYFTTNFVFSGLQLKDGEAFYFDRFPFGSLLSEPIDIDAK